MSEPEYFRSERAGKNYMEDKGKQLRWLMHKTVHSKTDEERDKNLQKLKNWLHTHPLLKEKAIKDLEEQRPDIALLLESIDLLK